MTSLALPGKLLRLAIHLLRGWWIIRVKFPRLDAGARHRCVEVWAGQLLALTGIELDVGGAAPAAGPVLFVANHLSWLDIIVVHAASYCSFISKPDIGRWPVIRTLAGGADTLYVERGSRRDTHRMVGRMAERLRAGDSLAVFPEGTTGDGILLKPFHANLVQAAISAGVPIQPLGIRFVDARSGRVSHAARYIDDDGLGESIVRILAAPPLRAILTFGEPQPAAGRDRREWAAALREDIDGLRRRA